MAKKRKRYSRKNRSFKRSSGRSSRSSSRPTTVRLEIIQSSSMAALSPASLQTGMVKPPPPKKAMF